MFKLMIKYKSRVTIFIRNFFNSFFVSATKYHIDKANEMILLKSNNLSMYGKGYCKTLEYAKIELSENWHLLMFNIYNSFLAS
jgi:hypothetical protein